MTILSDAELANIASNRFALDFVRAKLVQQASVCPKIRDAANQVPNGAGDYSNAFVCFNS